MDDYFVAHRLVKTRIFGDRTVHAYVTLSKSGSYRLFFSTVDPMALHMSIAWQENKTLRNTSSKHMAIYPLKSIRRHDNFSLYIISVPLSAFPFFRIFSSFFFSGNIYFLVHRAMCNRSIQCFLQTFNTDIDIFAHDLSSPEISIVEKCCNTGRCNSGKGVKHKTSFICHRQHKTFDQSDRELTRMNGFLNMIIFDVRNIPYILRILSKRIPGKLTFLRSFEMALFWIFRRNTNGIEIKHVVI